MPVANDLENGKESGTLFEDKAIILGAMAAMTKRDERRLYREKFRIRLFAL